uniref:Uncharacterized protein n=1 Tax=Capitella teleta TaxID=283909 RepID=X2AYL1_CAPTE
MATIRAINNAGDMSLSAGFKDIFSCCFGKPSSDGDVTGHEVLKEEDDDEAICVDDSEGHRKDYGSVRTGRLGSDVSERSQTKKSRVNKGSVRSLAKSVQKADDDDDDDSALVMDTSSQNGKGSGYNHDSSSESDDEVLRKYQQNVQHRPPSSARSDRSARSNRPRKTRAETPEQVTIEQERLTTRIPEIVPQSPDRKIVEEDKVKLVPDDEKGDRDGNSSAYSSADESRESSGQKSSRISGLPSRSNSDTQHATGVANGAFARDGVPSPGSKVSPPSTLDDTASTSIPDQDKSSTTRSKVRPL